MKIQRKHTFVVYKCRTPTIRPSRIHGPSDRSHDSVIYDKYTKSSKISYEADKTDCSDRRDGEQDWDKELAEAESVTCAMWM
jgi:hypothetical protein